MHANNAAMGGLIGRQYYSGITVALHGAFAAVNHGFILKSNQDQNDYV